MNSRLWYPQLDVYDCVRRLAALSLAYSEPPGIKRLRIADLFLASPPLLHGCQMTRETRRSFSSLAIPRPQKTFLTYPAAPLLFSRMERVQKEALRAMVGKGLVSINGFQRGVVALSEAGTGVFTREWAEGLPKAERELIRFLTEKFAVKGGPGAGALTRSAGLRRAS